jgi:type II secretory pathway pseudopilin PulG
MRPRSKRGFALLPVMFALALLAIATALLIERGGVEQQIGANGRQADALEYAAQGAYAHAKAVLGQARGCAALPTGPVGNLGPFTYTTSLTASTPAPSTTYSFAVTADAWLESGNTTKAHGLEKDLRAKTKSGDYRRPVLSFNLSGLPADADIASASLILYVKNEDPTGSPVEVYRVTSTWSEATVTWANASANYDGAWLQASFTPLAIGTVAADVTRLARAWAAGAIPNDGLYLVATSNNEESVYASREEGDPTRRPRLDVITRPKLRVTVDARAASSDAAERDVTASIDGPANGALFLDYFDAAYAGSDGTRDWTGNWQETGENNGSSSGAVRVVTSSDCAYGSCLRLDAGLLSNVGAWRELNIVGGSTAVLHTDTRRDGGNWALQISRNGGSSWQTLKSVAAGSDAKQVRDTFDVSAYVSANTRVRFTSSQLLGLGNHYVYVDNVEIEAGCSP